MTAAARAFLAVHPPAAVLDALEDRLRALPAVDGVRRVPRDQWHVTLRFCGRVPGVDALVSVVGDALAGVGPVVGLQLAGAGGFPRARHASVLWVGVEPGEASSALARVAAATETACVAAGLAPDDRAFRPHVTVARASRARDLRGQVEGLDTDPVGPRWTATEVRLVASDTRPTGAVHTVLAMFPL